MSVTHLVLCFWWKQKTYRLRPIKWTNERHSSNVIFLMREENVSIAINQMNEWTSLIERYVFDEGRERIDCDQSNERMSVIHLVLCFWWKQRTYRLRSIKWTNERHSSNVIFLMREENVPIAINQMSEWASLIERYVFGESRERTDCDQSDERMSVTHLILCFWWKQKTYRLRSIRWANGRHSPNVIFLMKRENVPIAINQMSEWASHLKF